MEENIILAKPRKIGGSLVITIPSNIVKSEQIDETQFLEVKVRKKRVDGFGILKGIGSFTREDRAKGQLEK
ncbi:MAG: hypothetical protein AABW80_05495 [Nanoarchaeota archaeon]